MAACYRSSVVSATLQRPIADSGQPCIRPTLASGRQPFYQNPPGKDPPAGHSPKGNRTPITTLKEWCPNR